MTPSSAKQGAQAGTIRRLLGAGSLYTIATVAPILTLLAVTPLVTRFLGSDAYSEVAVAITVYQFTSVLFAFGLPTAITRNAIIEQGGHPSASGLVMAGAAIAIVGLVIALLSVPLWAGMLFPGVSHSVLAAALIAGAGLAVVTLSQALLRAAERVVVFVALGASASFLPPVLGVILLHSVGPTPEVYTEALAVGYALVAIASVVVTIAHARPTLTVAELRLGIGIGLPTVPHMISVPLLTSIAVSIVIQADGLAAAGRLQIAAMLGTAGITVMNAVNNAWSPMILKASAPERARTLASTTSVVSLLALAMIAAYTVVGPYLVKFIGGPVADDGAVGRASMVIWLATVFHVLYLANIHLTFLSGRTLALALTTPLSAVVSLGALAWIVHVVDGAGVQWHALVWPVFYALQAIASYLLARRGPFQPARIRSALPALALGAVLCIQAATVSPQPLISLIVAPICLVAAIARFVLLRSKVRAEAG